VATPLTWRPDRREAPIPFPAHDPANESFRRFFQAARALAWLERLLDTEDIGGFFIR